MSYGLSSAGSDKPSCPAALACRPNNHTPAELTSWKEIADYLGVTVRTAQKWEAERGLPVRRLAGEKGRVSAATAELERWRRSALEKPGWWASLTFLRIYAAAATALLLVGLGVALGLYLSGSRKGPPAQFLHDFRTLVVTDRSGRELWRRTFDDPFQPGQTPEVILDKRQAWFGDLDGDGRIELLYMPTVPRLVHPEAPLYSVSPTTARSAGGSSPAGPCPRPPRPSRPRTCSTPSWFSPPAATASGASPSPATTSPSIRLRL